MPAAAQAAGFPSRLGKYELLMPLAAGGMARIYIGRSTGIGQFERHVVLKMITPERANDLTAVNMFLDEARLAASLNHQNVGQVFEVGEEGGIHYLAMEYVHGQDLRAVLAKAGSAGTRIPLELALTVVAGAAAGLNHAHERRGPDGTPLGIVHRDVSPSNIMIGYDGAVKLLDFGIAKATMRSVQTQSGIIKGKFAYMAPEQCRGRDVDRRSDVFSLGIILYEISTQHRCFRADSDFDTMHRIVTGDVVRPTRLVQGYPQALEAIVMKALALEASQRYQSAGLLLEAIEAFGVSARMSLSTMGLGRFMRDMFGEQQEPWLNASMRMAAASVVAKENTISSTDGRASGGHPRNQQATAPNEVISDGAPDEEGRFEDSGENDAAKTILQLPSSSNDPDDAPQPEWNAKSYPSAQPSSASSETLPPEAQVGQHGSPYGHAASNRMPITAPPSTVQGYDAPPRPTPTPNAPYGTQPLPAGRDLAVPQGQFPQHHTPKSGSSPALAAFSTPNGGVMPPGGAIATTKHGYASGGGVTRGDVSYPRYEPPTDSLAGADIQLRPNRRPLFIGLGVVILGVIVMLAVTVGGGSSKEENAAVPDDHGSANGGGSSDVPKLDKVATPGSGSSASDPDDGMISVVVESEPSGADVMIAGAKIGSTPFNGPFKRGSKIVQLSVHKDGYVDFTGRIDLGGEYENKNIKLVPIEDAKGSAGSASTGSNAQQGSGSGSGAPNTGGTTSNTGGTTGGTTHKTGGTSGGTTTQKTGGTTGGTGKTGGTTGTGKTTDKKPPVRCQPPGPNVDPFGAPVCKT